MKQTLFTILLSGMLFTISNSQSIGVGTQTPNASSVFDISSTTKGLLIPRMTSAQRTAIPTPATGLLVFDTNTNQFYFYNGSSWNAIAGSGSALTLPYEGTVDNPGTAFRITNSGNAIEGNSTSGNGLNVSSVTGAGLNSLSSSGFGIITSSTSSTALYAFSNNELPTINSTNSNGLGVAIKGNSSAHNAILGVSAGTSKAGIRGESTGPSGIGVFGTSTQATGYGVYGNVGTGIGVYGFSSSGTGVRANSGSGLALEVIGKLKISGGNTNPSNGAVLTSDASGNAVWKNNRVAFSAKGVADQMSGLADNFWLKMEYKTEEFDYANNFVPTVGTPGTNSSVFTVTKNGLYHFDAACAVVSNTTGDCTAYLALILKRGGVTSFLGAKMGAPNHYYSLWTDFDILVSRDVALQTGDQVWVEVMQYNTDDASGHASTSNFIPTFFNGHLLIED
ncbi:MAG TPA: hypothetical protein VMZ69_03260 [Saprospiraceae bacterium]|nr:hypothetical protein [Saprospiraceae bacterium]